ncbi:MAG TPA: hypothetical protein VGH36_04320 [Acetobacteraceae bacterium]
MRHQPVGQRLDGSTFLGREKHPRARPDPHWRVGRARHPGAGDIAARIGAADETQHRHGAGRQQLTPEQRVATHRAS